MKETGGSTEAMWQTTDQIDAVSWGGGEAREGKERKGERKGKPLTEQSLSALVGCIMEVGKESDN